MNQLDPLELFERISSDIPAELHGNLIVAGSLAAAYEFRTKLASQAVNTKDADLIVHPAGKVESCAQMTEELLGIGWRRTEMCFAQNNKQPLTNLRAIRLFPPESNDYFIEFLNVPSLDQPMNKAWIPMKLSDGWYGLPSFRFMSVISVEPKISDQGIEYANVAMMALSNLLSHAQLGDSRIESGAMQGILRSAKDLGRVIALAYLAEREATEGWVSQWVNAINQCFPRCKQPLAATLGDGLIELINDQNALEEAFRTTDVGLLNGMSVTPENLKVTGERLIVDVIEPVKIEFDFTS